jgi:hypothetical protein
MYKRRGSLTNQSNSKHIFLKNPEGKSYKVNFVTAFVWDLLDGNRSTPVIAKEIQKTAKLESEELPSVVSQVILELKKVGLVQEKI